MKKKYLIPMGTIMLLYLIIFIVVLAGSITALIKMDLGTVQIIVICLLNILILYYLVSPIFFYGISIDNEKVSIKSDFSIFKEDRVQKAVSVNYGDIKEYKVILSDRDSEGNAYKGKTQKKKYIEFVLNDGSKKRIYVSMHNNKQILLVLNTVKEKTNLDVITE